MQISRGAALAIGGLVVAGAATAAGIAHARSRGEVDGEPGEVPAPSPSGPPASPVPPVSAPPGPERPRPVPAPSTPATPSGPATPTTPDVPAAPVSPEDPAASYTVQRGDTLSAIARRFGTTVGAIAELNDIADPGLIQVGQVLRIPGRATPAPVDRPTTPSAGPVTRVAGAGSRVALTFDDGPNGAYTDAILATLERRGVRATFFVVGRQAARDSANLLRMRDAGHAIGNHSWDHAKLTSLPPEDVRRQLEDTSNTVERITGTRPDTFRPPYGARSAAIDATAAELGMRDILWDVDTVDWSRPGVDAIARSAIDDARNGSVILLHDGGGNREQTVAALDRIITGLQGRGLELVTVPELLAGAG